MNIEPSKQFRESRKLEASACCGTVAVRRISPHAYAFALASLILFVFVILTPQTVNAHGEMLIRIADVSREIAAATNNAAQLYLKRGELHREHLDWAAAETDYARAEQLDPKLDRVDFCRAKMLDDSGQLKAAHALFDKVIARSPSDGEAFIGRARVAVKLSLCKSAITDFHRGLKLLTDPRPEYFLEFAQVLVSAGQNDEGLRRLDGAIEKFGPILMLQSYALELELGRENHNAAIARLDTILKQAFRKEDWLARRGEVLLTAGRPAEAEDSFNAALNAIDALPSRIQKGPAMLKLKTRIHAALVGGGNDSTPPEGKLNFVRNLQKDE